MTLQEFFTEYPAISIAFSGGVDSAYLLYYAHKYAKRVKAYYMKTPFQPAFEEADAIRFCKQYNISLSIIEHDILSNEQVKANPVNRCYYCKKAIFSAISKAALADGYTVICDGTNASDDVTDRPGMKALEELLVQSPLRICGLTKDVIRKESKAAGLFTWNKPSYACLATRITTDTPICQEDLIRVEKSEDILFSLGFRDYRVRIYHDAARIQLPEAQMPLAVELHDLLCKMLAPYFTTVMLDLFSR